MKKTCIQCGKEFELTGSEIEFYKKRKLALPKRCKACRDLNKKDRSKQKMKESGAELLQKKADNKPQQPRAAAEVQMQQERRNTVPGKNKLLPVVAAVGIVALICILLVLLW